MKIIIGISLILTLSIVFPCYAGDLIRGRSIYGMSCVVCHGEFGRGDGPRADEFQPRPINFTDSQVMQTIPPEKFEKSVVEGLPNVIWHTFGNLLTPEEVRAVTEYVRSFIR